MLTYSHHIFIKYEVHLTELCRVLLKLSSTIFLNECLPSSQKRENILISSFLQYTGDAFDRSDTSRFLFSQIIFAVISRLTDVCLLQIFFKLLFSHYLFDWLEKKFSSFQLLLQYSSDRKLRRFITSVQGWLYINTVFKNDQNCLIIISRENYIFTDLKVEMYRIFVRWDFWFDFETL